MTHSGTKLVVCLAGLATLAAAVSWWYHFGAKHRATRFWGSAAAPLIARPSQVEVFRLRRLEAAGGNGRESAFQLDLGRSYAATRLRELSHARGMVHLRHALMSDLNYQWKEAPQPGTIDWGWCLRFSNPEQQAMVVLAEDLETLGVIPAGGKPLRTVSCRPMVESLRHYFEDLGLLPASRLR